MNIVIIDPGLTIPGKPKFNLGDLIIQQAVTREIEHIFGKSASIYRVCPHTRMTKRDIERIEKSDKIFIGGSNLVGNGVFRRSKLQFWRQWKINFHESRSFNNKAIMLGIGWRKYEGRTGFYTRTMLNACLNKDTLHSVRDEYTKRKFNAIGFENVLNTGCPTIWPLANMASGFVPKRKAENVLLMLTNYSMKPEFDSKLIKLLSRNYEQIFFWPQGLGDKDYVSTLSKEIKFIPETLEALNAFVHSGAIFDYVGTRLHGGIYCLLAGHRALILKIDNRTTELARNTGLPAVDREDIASIVEWIKGPTATRVNTNVADIEKWKGQFKANNREYV